MIETQVLMTLFNFLVFFSRNHFLEGASLFNGVVCFSVKRGGVIFKGGGRGVPHVSANVLWGVEKSYRIYRVAPMPPPSLPLWETLVNLHQKSVSLHQSVMFGINDYL